MAEPHAAPPGAFDRDTAVLLEHGSESGTTFAAEVSSDWRAGRGPHGGYLAAMLLRALVETVGDPGRAPRSLTIHYPRAPQPGPVQISTTIERQGRSLSTVSGRMEQQGSLVALALAAFSVPWSAPEISELPIPSVAPPEPTREAGALTFAGAPPFTRHIVLQPRLGGMPFGGSDQPMEFGGWIGLAEPRPVDALSLAFFSDALIPTPFMRLEEPMAAPTVDLTVHFRAPGRGASADEAHELLLARTRTSLIHDGFFEEDGVIWAADGSVLAQSRQLAILLPLTIR